MDILTLGILVVLGLIALFFVVKFVGGCLVRFLVIALVLAAVAYLIYLLFFQGA
ncbi:MAG: hypothetical protein HYX96_03155 [Chloroflexi bacterium]|nr:hypothetical protein [Chloroflexota bacterium]